MPKCHSTEQILSGDRQDAPLARQATHFRAQRHLLTGGNHSLPRFPLETDIIGQHASAKKCLCHLLKIGLPNASAITQLGNKLFLKNDTVAWIAMEYLLFEHRLAQCQSN